MDKAEFKDNLVSYFPAFEGYWGEEYINKEKDGSFNAHGLLSSFFFFYKENHMNFHGSTVRDFADTLEEIVAADPNDESDVANAICTSFLELINKKKEGMVLEQYLGTECSNFLKAMRGENGS